MRARARAVILPVRVGRSSPLYIILYPCSPLLRLCVLRSLGERSLITDLLMAIGARASRRRRLVVGCWLDHARVLHGGVLGGAVEGEKKETGDPARIKD